MSKIVVFAGRGSSHSWTWFAEFLERAAEYDARFLDSTEFVGSLRGRPEIVVLSGGDGFAIADAMKGQGFSGLKDLISRGARYVGICAGAYLPLPSRVEPFSEFNISTTKIENIVCTAPDPEVPPRLSVSYGSCSIVHPVRGDVELSTDGKKTHAPLFGGPVFREPEKDAVLMRYSGFGADTEFQIERERAERMMLGRPAGVMCEYGKGTLTLLGPHLEHPSYPEANHLLLEILGIEQGRRRVSMGGEKTPPSLARTLADLKVAARGLEGRSFLVGRKLWDAGRFLELAGAIDRHARSLDPDEVERVRTDLDTVRSILVKTEVGEESDVDEATVLLINSARACVDSHFMSMVASR